MTRPMGEYPRSHIDRPYTLPENVVKGSFGAQTSNLKLKKASDSVTNVQETDSYISPSFALDARINDNLTWVYPIGLRWRIYHDETHNIGVAGGTLLLYNYIGFDYWYRLSPRWSLRPSATGRHLNLIFIEESQTSVNLDVVFQATENWSLSLIGSAGDYSTKSELIERIVTGITNDDFSTEVKGEFYSVGISTLYSLSPEWDVTASLSYKQYDLTYEFTGIEGSLGFNMFW